MKTKRLSKILGLGLATGLVLASLAAIFASPVSADLMKWGIVNTPSWEDHVIEPGSDIHHYDIDGEDGNTIVALGEIGGSHENNTPCGGQDNAQGLTGSFYISGGTFTIEAISSDVADICITVNGNACYLMGEFAAVIDVEYTFVPFEAVAAVTGEVTANQMTLCGKLYRESGSFPPDGNYSIGSDTMCVNDGHILTTTLFTNFTIGGGDSIFRQPRVWKSTDGGVTWSDITSTVQGTSDLPGPFLQFAYGDVAIAQDDTDWLAISGGIFHPDFFGVSGNNGLGLDLRGVPATVASKDGAANFDYAGDMNDAGNGTWMALIYDVDVSIETASGVHIIAVAGINDDDLADGWDGDELGAVFRLDAGTWLTGSWVDTSLAYAGWDSGLADPVLFPTWGVVDGEFSPNFDIDDTYVCFGVDGYGEAYLQSGIWEGSTGSWNSNAGFSNAVNINADGDTLLTEPALFSVGLALPADYDGSDPGARAIFIYVNAFNTVTGQVGGFLMRVDNSAVSEPFGPSGEPLLASIDFHGDADTGKMMIGEYIKWDNDEEEEIPFGCCEGVRVWHTVELDPCCPDWELACKNPSGPYAAQVMYTPDGVKSYAATSGMVDWEYVDPWAVMGGLSDESAFSVSRDDGVSFNQLGLIDTDIDLLVDVAVCPDCSTIYLSTINELEMWGECCARPPREVWQVANCDSVWRSYDDGDTWERIYHGDWDGLPLLRLPCDAVEDCCDQDPASPSGTVYLAIQGTNDIFYSRDCGQCWNDPPATKVTIQDVAVESENIVYVIDTGSNFSMSTQYGRRWSDSVDMGLNSSWTITACCVEGFIVVGPASNDKVAWSDDGGETWNQTDTLPATATALIQVACDPNCPNIVYAASYVGGIYRTDLTDGSWTDMNAVKSYYTGLAVARTGGTLYASSYLLGIDTDPVPAEDYCLGRRIVDYDDASVNTYRSGVARNLTPCETDCCGTEDWDYLICGLGDGPTEYFMAQPSALRICGCLTADTNSVLWAIDWVGYDVTDGSDGSLWSYEDCAAKIGPTLTAPADGTVIDCEPCAGCDAANFTLEWERMCEACSYDIQIMDADGNLIVSWDDISITGDPPTLFIDGTLDGGYYYLECGETYTWHVREADTACECVHSPWSETWSFTVAVGAADAIQLLAPIKGALDTPVENIGFSWTGVRNATTYSFVLSPNANLAGALVSQDMSTTAFNFVGPLDYSKAYYWQIIAWQDGVRLTTSSIGVFNTMAQPVAPQPPVVVEEQPAPVINIPAAQQITPTWIYVIIGIGAALVVVTIVLIVRTRRP